MTIDDHNITRSPLGKLESAFVARVATLTSFSLEDARSFFGKKRVGGERQFLDRLRKKGWIERITHGKYAVIPLSSGSTRTTQLHEFHIAMELVEPAAIAYYSALNHHGMTEQLPRTVFVATDHRVSRSIRESLGFRFKIVCLQKRKFFGTTREWRDERPFLVTDREKTIVDGLDLPENVGGVGTVAEALRSSWKDIDEVKLRDYAVRMGVSAVAKRLGYLMENLGLGNPEALRERMKHAAGFSRLDPTLPAVGKYNRRWGLLVNARVKA